METGLWMGREHGPVRDVINITLGQGLSGRYWAPVSPKYMDFYNFEDTCIGIYLCLFHIILNILQPWNIASHASIFGISTHNVTSTGIT